MEAQFHGGRTSFGFAEFHGERTSFAEAQFRSKEWTGFVGAEFHSEEWTLFARAEFHSEETLFDSPGAWNNVYFDWDPDPEDPEAVKGTKPDNVTPHNWPPTVVEPVP